MENPNTCAPDAVVSITTRDEPKFPQSCDNNVKQVVSESFASFKQELFKYLEDKFMAINHEHVALPEVEKEEPQKVQKPRGRPKRSEPVEIVSNSKSGTKDRKSIANLVKKQALNKTRRASEEPKKELKSKQSKKSKATPFVEPESYQDTFDHDDEEIEVPLEEEAPKKKKGVAPKKGRKVSKSN